jgi:hypothetical protein
LRAKCLYLTLSRYGEICGFSGSAHPRAMLELKMQVCKQVKAKAQEPDTSTSTDTLYEFHAAVIEGKQILKEIEVAERGQLRLGELADKLEPTYGDRTLAKYADELGIAKCTLDRYRTVYRAWEGKLAPGPISTSYAVLRELATHPDREQILQDKPGITKREAHDEMRKLKGAAQEEQEQEEEKQWAKDNRRLFWELYSHAQEVSRRVDAVLNSPPEKQQEFLEVIEPLLLTNMGGFGRRLVNFVDHFEALLETEAAEAKTTPIEPAHPEAPAHVVN